MKEAPAKEWLIHEPSPFSLDSRRLRLKHPQVQKVLFKHCISRLEGGDLESKS